MLYDIQTAKAQELTSKKNEIERTRLQIESGNNNTKELKNKLSDQEMQANEVGCFYFLSLSSFYIETNNTV